MTQTETKDEFKKIMADINLDPSWKTRLGKEFEKDYMVSLKKFLQSELLAKKNIFPKGNEYFAALNATSFEKVRVVILGQDPYHGHGQAHGLCFSVKPGIKNPPSLQNIFKELNDDLGVPISQSGDLTKWAEQGVLLLNSVLTVEEGLAGSHQNKGWENFTDAIIELLNTERKNIVYLLWGSYAQKKASFVVRNSNLVIKSPHPSPLSSYRGFFGSKPFSKTNSYLKKQGIPQIDWSL